MIHALHGNVGLPEDLSVVLRDSRRPFRAWHLWRCLRESPEAATLRGFGTALQRAAEKEESRRAVLFGYSLGARLALHSLTDSARRWDAAILLSAHPGLITEEERAARLIQDQLWSVRFLRDPWDDVINAWNAQPVLASDAAPLQDRHPVETWRQEVARAFDAWSLGRQENLRPKLPAITCPVLWITGARDEKFTSLAKEVCPLIPGGRHVEIPDAGHRAHHDQPALVAEEIDRFLVSAGC